LISFAEICAALMRGYAFSDFAYLSSLAAYALADFGPKYDFTRDW